MRNLRKKRACHEKSGPGQNLVRGDQLLLQISVPVAKIGPCAHVRLLVLRYIHVRSCTRKTLLVLFELGVSQSFQAAMRPHLLRCFEEGQIYIVPVTRMTQLPRVTMIECSLCKNADFCIKVPRG